MVLAGPTVWHPSKRSEITVRERLRPYENESEAFATEDPQARFLWLAMDYGSFNPDTNSLTGSPSASA